MADSQYPYPPDRFDDEADAVSFHGAHRAELPFWRENLLYIIIIGAAAVVLVVLLFMIGGMGGDEDDRAEDPVTTSAEATEGEGGGEESPEAEETSAEETTPPPAADKSTPLLVVNAGGQGGLAGTWRDTLEGEGWEDVSVATADDFQDQPEVHYRDEEDAETAQALAAELGVDEAVQSDEYDAAVVYLAVEFPDEGEDGEEG